MSFRQIIVSAGNFILIIAQNDDKAMSTQSAHRGGIEDMLIDLLLLWDVAARTK